MTDPITAAVEALEDKLRTITQANGYLTDAGLNLVREFAAILLGQGHDVPLLALQPESTGQPTSSAGRGKIPEQMQIVLAVNALPALGNTPGASDQLRSGLYDLRKCLHQHPNLQVMNGKAISVEAGAASYDITDDSKYALAVLPVTLTIIENYEV